MKQDVITTIWRSKLLCSCQDPNCRRAHECAYCHEPIGLCECDGCAMCGALPAVCRDPECGHEPGECEYICDGCERAKQQRPFRDAARAEAALADAMIGVFETNREDDRG